MRDHVFGLVDLQGVEEAAHRLLSERCCQRAGGFGSTINGDDLVRFTGTVDLPVRAMG